MAQWYVFANNYSGQIKPQNYSIGFERGSTVIDTNLKSIDFCIFATLIHFVSLESKVKKQPDLVELLLIPYICINHTEIESRYCLCLI